MNRLARKAAEIRTWIGSVRGPADWPAAFVLGIFRTRQPSGDSPAARLARWLFPCVWVRPKMLQGLWLRMNPAQLSHFVIYEEVFIAGVYDLGRLAFEPDTIVDCGAFEGYFSLLARTRFGSAPIVAFEPNAQNFEGLKANIARNHLTIDARAAAVSTRDGEATFSGGGCGGRLTDQGPEVVRVPVSDLRRVLSELAPKRLLLKLDVEGEEATLLPAVLPVLPQQTALYFEWHQGEASFRAMATLLQANGFSTSLMRANDVGDGTVYIDAFAQRT